MDHVITKKRDKKFNENSAGQAGIGATSFLEDLIRIMRNKSLLQRIFLLTSFGLFSASVHAQEVKVKVEDPSYDELESPELGGNTNFKKFKPKNWLEAEVQLKVEVDRRSDKEFLDRLTIKWYVAVKNPADKGKVSMITKDVTYVNVAVGEELYASVYLSPSAIRRITGGDRAGKGNVEAVAGEVLYNGVKVGVFNTKSGSDWWTKVSRTDGIPLLSKTETPFKFLWWDRYLEEEAPRR